MPLLFPWVAYLIGTSLSAVVFRVAAVLGVGLITYTGSQFVLDRMVAYFIDYANELPPKYLAIMGYVYVDRAFSLIVSAAAVAVSITASKSVIGARKSS